ncbi:hypothetical protein ACQPW1_18250 [Nocardia sp. CA-128927]|uniref:hypothetical protein n=1 Tax=Nocardia sp. CA-128927 TaxID=3239975 RepID=UPI003D97F92E
MRIDSASTAWVPDSCTLPTAEQPMRVAEFDQFFATSVHHLGRPRRTRLDLLIDADAETLGRDLAARETACCSFFTFTFEDTVMHIDVSAAHADILDALETRFAATGTGLR